MGGTGSGPGGQGRTGREWIYRVNSERSGCAGGRRFGARRRVKSGGFSGVFRAFGLTEISFARRGNWCTFRVSHARGRGDEAQGPTRTGGVETSTARVGVAAGRPATFDASGDVHRDESSSSGRFLADNSSRQPRTSGATENLPAPGVAALLVREKGEEVADVSDGREGRDHPVERREARERRAGVVTPPGGVSGKPSGREVRSKAIGRV